MFEKWKNILTVGLLSAFVLGFGIWAAVKPADALSTSERRPLAQMPELSANSYLSGNVPGSSAAVCSSRSRSFGGFMVAIRSVSA